MFVCESIQWGECCVCRLNDMRRTRLLQLLNQRVAAADLLRYEHRHGESVDDHHTAQATKDATTITSS